MIDYGYEEMYATMIYEQAPRVRKMRPAKSDHKRANKAATIARKKARKNKESRYQ